MAAADQRVLLQYVRRLFGAGTLAGLNEWELLHRYLNERDELAFEAIVARHGPMVLAVCRRLLDDPYDAEDAFQATFLVLVRKGRSLGPGDAIGNWLYGVANRVALRARAVAARRRVRERNGPAVEQMGAPNDNAQTDLKRVFDEELGRLSDRYRKPLVLCYLEGLSHDQAARELGWPIGTLKGRLARAKDQLRGRLVRRGVSLSVVALATAMEREAQAALPPALLKVTVETATKLTTSALIPAGAISASVASLTQGVIRAMFLSQLKLVAAVAGAAGVLVAGAGYMAVGAQDQEQNKGGQVEVAQVAKEGQRDPSEASKEKAGLPAESPAPREAAANPDPLMQLAHWRLEAAQKAFETGAPDFEVGRLSLDRLAGLSKNWLTAQREMDDSLGNQIGANQAHLQRIRDVEKRERAKLEVGRGTATDVAEAEYYRREAELWLAQAKAGRGATGTRLTKQRSHEDLSTNEILKKLDAPIPIHFPDETPLEDVLKYIKIQTAGPDHKSFPIYVDPVGLQVAEKTLQSPISLDLEGVPLRITLRLMLKQLGLTYYVRDGMMTINEESSGDMPFRERLELAKKGEVDKELVEALTRDLENFRRVERLLEARTLFAAVREGFRVGLKKPTAVAERRLGFRCWDVEEPQPRA